MISSDRVLGILGGAMVLGAVVLLVLGGEGDTGAAAGADEPPPIEQISPTDGATAQAPLAVVFRLPVELERLPGGWGTGQHHLHLELDGVEIMPAAADIETVGDREYRWTIPEVEPGPHAVRLLWSGPDHRPLPETATPLARVVVR